jgi:hypothetical protein
MVMLILDSGRVFVPGLPKSNCLIHPFVPFTGRHGAYHCDISTCEAYLFLFAPEHLIQGVVSEVAAQHSVRMSLERSATYNDGPI